MEHQNKTPQQLKRRRYKLHYNLRKRGNKVVTREMFVVRRARTLPAIEEKWCKELVAFNYAVCDDMFTT